MSIHYKANDIDLPSCRRVAVAPSSNARPAVSLPTYTPLRTVYVQVHYTLVNNLTEVNATNDDPVEPSSELFRYCNF